MPIIRRQPIHDTPVAHHKEGIAIGHKESLEAVGNFRLPAVGDGRYGVGVGLCFGLMTVAIYRIRVWFKKHCIYSFYSYPMQSPSEKKLVVLFSAYMIVLHL